MDTAFQNHTAQVLVILLSVSVQCFAGCIHSSLSLLRFMSVSIRDATLDDAEAMTEIFNEAVDEGAQTWDEHLSVTEAIDWMSKLHLHGYPCIILQNEAYSVLGYASLEPRSTSRYSGTKFAANLTCHVRASARRQGYAALLLNALFDHPNTVSRNVYLVRCESLHTSDQPS